jgi:hypothetical protein
MMMIMRKMHRAMTLRHSWPRQMYVLYFESRVHEFVPNSRIVWFGNGTGMNAYHTFLLIRTGEGCRIVTEEVVKGPGAVEFQTEAAERDARRA